MQRIEISKPEWSMTRDGARISLATTSLTDAQRLCESLKPGKQYEMTVTEKRRRRSLDANALMWVLLGEMAQRVRGQDADSLYRMYVRHSPNYYTVIIPGNQLEKLKRDWEHNGLAWFADQDDVRDDGSVYVRLYYGSSQYDSKQMAALIDAILQDASAIGIDTSSESFRALCEQYPRGQ